MSSFKTTKFAKAVRHALENTDIGTKSSVKALIERALEFYNGTSEVSSETGSSHYTAACAIRTAFRIQNGLGGEDARTYETQHRRDMLSDQKMSRKKWQKVQDMLDKLPLPKLSKLLAEFHSIDQARLAVATCQQAAQFVTIE